MHGRSGHAEFLDHGFLPVETQSKGARTRLIRGQRFHQRRTEEECDRQGRLARPSPQSIQQASCASDRRTGDTAADAPLRNAMAALSPISRVPLNSKVSSTTYAIASLLAGRTATDRSASCRSTNTQQASPSTSGARAGRAPTPLRTKTHIVEREHDNQRAHQNGPREAQAFRFVRRVRSRPHLLNSASSSKGQGGRQRQRKRRPTPDGNPAGRAAAVDDGRSESASTVTHAKVAADTEFAIAAFDVWHPVSAQGGVPGRKQRRECQAEQMGRDISAPPESHYAQQAAAMPPNPPAARPDPRAMAVSWAAHVQRHWRVISAGADSIDR